MFCLIQNTEEFNNDLRVMLQAFYPGVKIITPANVEKKPELAGEVAMTLVADVSAAENFCQVDVALYKGYFVEGAEDADALIAKDTAVAGLDSGEPDHTLKKLTRDSLKRKLYNILSTLTNRTLPWGTLTGVKPVKIAVADMEQGLSDETILSHYKNTYLTSTEKATTAIEIAHKEGEIIGTVDEENEYCLYVGIPFCPTRCLYCSFTSYPIDKYEGKVEDYLDAVEREISFVADAYKSKRLISIYIGGGTPSAISAERMDRLLTDLENAFDLTHLREFTVEAGRPDSTTAEKLEVMKRHGVTRVSINPQTMNQETLQTIGRAHTPDMAAEAFARARAAGFDNINMDLIVGLPGEDVTKVAHTLERIKELAPDSMTVHTLAIKRAANLKQQLDDYKDSIAGDTDEQLSLVNKFARENDLLPYYLYRQKNMAGNLENVGYAKAGLECIYNILIMEERLDIIGIGAGSSSKYVVRNVDGFGKRVERTENCKNVDDYITRIDEMIDRKRTILGTSTNNE